MWDELAERQEGVVSRRQLLRLGLTSDQARARVRLGRWQTLWPGVYVIHTGPVPERARARGAVLYCGEGALAGGRTALWLARALPQYSEPFEVCVPSHRQVQKIAGITVYRVRGLEIRAQTAADPPRVRIEHAVLDVADRATEDEAVCDVVLRTLQRRLTTAGRIEAALATRSRHRWRSLISEMLRDFGEGAHSPLELRYLRKVERAHGLPRGLRNLRERRPDGSSRYRDVRYPRYRLIVELDGREAHPSAEAFRDLRRDNSAVVDGDTTLRYGWRDVAGRPCSVARQVADALTVRGRPGRARWCGPECANPWRP